MVNIDTVYQRVLLLANKEQRGYITPEEFNSFAEQAQLEIVESYWGKKIQSSQIPPVSDEYGDAAKVAMERLNYFNVHGAPATFDTTNNTYPYPADFYSLGMVNVASRNFPVMADEVTQRDLSYINLSPLTAPTAKQPVFIREEHGIIIYPKSYNNGVEIESSNAITFDYIRKPIQPIWAFMDDPTGEPVYFPPGVDENNNPIGSIHFEVNPAEEFNLVYRILTLAGVAIKQADISQFGASNES